jgi:hypothetical protein
LEADALHPSSLSIWCRSQDVYTYATDDITPLKSNDFSEEHGSTKH